MREIKLLLMMTVGAAAMLVGGALPVSGANTNTEIEEFCKTTMNQSQTVTNECLMKPDNYELLNEGDRAIISYLCCMGYFCIGRQGIRKDVTVYLGYADKSLQRLLLRVRSADSMRTIAKALICMREENIKRGVVSAGQSDDCVLLIAPNMFPNVEKATVMDLSTLKCDRT